MKWWIWNVEFKLRCWFSSVKFLFHLHCPWSLHIWVMLTICLIKPSMEVPILFRVMKMINLWQVPRRPNVLLNPWEIVWECLSGFIFLLHRWEVLHSLIGLLIIRRFQMAVVFGWPVFILICSLTPVGYHFNIDSFGLSLSSWESCVFGFVITLSKMIKCVVHLHFFQFIIYFRVNCKIF